MTIRADDRVLLLVSNFRCFAVHRVPALAGGGNCSCCRPAEESDPDGAFWIAWNATQLRCCPFFRTCFVFCWAGCFDRRAAILRLVFCGGGAMPADLPERAFSELREVQLFNLYGPTEAAIDLPPPTGRAVWASVKRSFPSAGPLPNVLSLRSQYRQRHPVPIGVVGELYVGGAQVCEATGMTLKLTKERFTPDPFRLSSQWPRLYRTGDRCRWRRAQRRF